MAVSDRKTGPCCSRLEAECHSSGNEASKYWVKPDLDFKYVKYFCNCSFSKVDIAQST
jgi:hypothetical protein